MLVFRALYLMNEQCAILVVLYLFNVLHGTLYLLYVLFTLGQLHVYLTTQLYQQAETIKHTFTGSTVHTSNLLRFVPFYYSTYTSAIIFNLSIFLYASATVVTDLFITLLT